LFQNFEFAYTDNGIYKCFRLDLFHFNRITRHGECGTMARRMGGLLKKNGRVLFLNLFLALFLASSAFGGADYYIRISGGIDWLNDANFRDGGGNGAALFGAANGSDGRPIGAYGDFDPYGFVEGAAGMRLLPWLRSEVALAYRPSMHYSGQANFIGVTGSQPVSGNADSLSSLLNFYFDANALPGVSFGRFQPYVGGGIGVAANWIGKMTYRFPQLAKHNYSIIPGGEKTDLAFMATAGTGFELTKHLMLDVSYRYTDLGRVQTDPGIMEMDTTTQRIGGTTAPLRAHGMLMGLRYHF
jgi:opacity protein-like surface antigen